MTRTEATDLVYDLIQSVREQERRSDDVCHFIHYEECRERVIAALSEEPAPAAESLRPDCLLCQPQGGLRLEYRSNYYPTKREENV